MSEAIGAFLLGLMIGAISVWIATRTRAQLRYEQARAEFEPQRAALEERLDAERRAREDAERAVGEERSKVDAMVQQKESEAMRRAAAESAIARIPGLESEAARLRKDLDQVSGERARLEERLKQTELNTKEKLALLDTAREKLLDAFKGLSGEALMSNNQLFLDLAKATLEKFHEGARGDLEKRQQAVDELVKPIRESLEKVDGKLGEIERARIGAYTELSTQVKGLVETHLPMLRNETANLVKALRQPTVRGRWGEMQLRRVVEMAGMLAHCDFVEQENRSTEDGRLRPDLIVKLPGGKQIVVDAKAAISAYLEAAEAPDEDTQRARLADHARQVRDHMVALGRKGYWEQFDPTPELVVMFLPGEMFFSAALQQDPGLIEFGVNEKVIPATPTTLIALLRAVAYGWRQEALAKNAQEVADLGRQLYERIAVLAGHWGDVGNRLDKAVEAYNKSVATLESRVLVSARRLRDLKAGPDDMEIEAIEPVERTARVLQGTAAIASSSGKNEIA
jgi:DNA recombination protein RmuC